MRYTTESVLLLIALNTAWPSTKTNSLVFANAKDRDSPPKSVMEMKSPSPITDGDHEIPSNVFAAKKKNGGIRANSKVAQSAFKSEEGIVGVMVDVTSVQESKVAPLKPLISRPLKTT